MLRFLIFRAERMPLQSYVRLWRERKVIIHGHPTSVRLEPAFWYWLRIIAAECGMTAKKFIECIRIAYPHDPLSSTLRVQITNYFYSQSPRTGFVDPESKFAFRIERPRKSRSREMTGRCELPSTSPKSSISRCPPDHRVVTGRRSTA